MFYWLREFITYRCYWRWWLEKRELEAGWNCSQWWAGGLLKWQLMTSWGPAEVTANCKQEACWSGSWWRAGGLLKWQLMTSWRPAGVTDNGKLEACMDGSWSYYLSQSPHWNEMWQKARFNMKNLSVYTQANGKNCSSPTTFDCAGIIMTTIPPSLAQWSDATLGRTRHLTVFYFLQLHHCP